MIDEPQLKMMKKNAILLNAARGNYNYIVGFREADTQIALLIASGVTLSLVLLDSVVCPN